MKNLGWWLAGGLFCAGSLGAVEEGDLWPQAGEGLGKPRSELHGGARSIYRWPQIELQVEAGRVVKVTLIDAKEEAVNTARREEIARAAEELETKERVRLQRLDEERRAQEERERPLKEKFELRARVEELDREVALLRQRASDLEAERDDLLRRDRNAQAHLRGLQRRIYVLEREKKGGEPKPE